MHGRVIRLLLSLGLTAALASSARAEVRAVRLCHQGTGFAAGRLEAGVTIRADGLHADRSALYASPPLDGGFTFSAIGPHWKGDPGAEVEIAVSADGLAWGRWIPAPSEETIEPLREDGTPNPLAGDALGSLVFVSPDSRWVRYRVRLPAREDGGPSLSRIGSR